MKIKTILFEKGIYMVPGFLFQATGKGSRSSGLHPLLWIFGLSLFTILSCYIVKASEWVVIVVIIFTFIVLCGILFAYFYFMVNNPEYLRSEDYSLSKMAIEKGLVGDSTNGLYDPVQQEQLNLNPNKYIIDGKSEDNPK